MDGGFGTEDRSDDETSGGGGGATDIRLVLGGTTELQSLSSRIMVAGAGGGASWYYGGGAGGGINGTTNYGCSPAGTQIDGYKFGIGENGHGIADDDGVAGGGAGYYGGRTADVGGQSAGAGGSGYISGHEGCIAINSEDDVTPKANTYTQISDSYHYSNKIFENTVLVDGNGQMPNYENNGNMTGNDGDGHCNIIKIQ